MTIMIPIAGFFGFDGWTWIRIKTVEDATALDSSVLVLNRYFMAVHVIPARRAFSLLCKEIAEVVHVTEDRYESFNFESWREVSQYRELFPDGDDAYDWIRTVSFEIRVPRVIRLLGYDKLPRQRVQFNRRNLFARDENRCQYCGHRFPSERIEPRPRRPALLRAGPRAGRTSSAPARSATNAKAAARRARRT